jgi:hypothetical protein
MDPSMLNQHHCSTGVGATALAFGLLLSATASAQPNLTPYKPAAWSDKIVVSSTTGTSTDSSPLNPTDTLYLDWAVLNSGNEATAARFYTELYVDDVLKASWYSDPPVASNTYVSIVDRSLGLLAAGTHTVKIKTDSTNAIAESDETDNEYTKTITVLAGAKPDLTPYKPSAWSDKIVVSKRTGTTTDGSPLYPTDTLYVDWEVLNSGNEATAARFYTELYVDDVLKHRWYSDPPLNPGIGVLVADFSLGRLAAGPHTVKIKTDSTNALAESNESDNEYTRAFVVSTPLSLTQIGSADFDGDLKSDILWRHVTLGEMWLWPMNGAARMGETYLGTVADTDWEIRGLGNQRGSGQAGILWRNRTTGMIYFWRMDGSTVLSQTHVATVDPAYDIVGTADYDGDGKSDILWRHLTNGEVWIWLMDGAVPLTQVYVGTVDPAYVAKGSGDLNGDGKADIVWHHETAGEVWVWLMDGTTPLSRTWVATVSDVGYQIVGVADFTGDSKTDILWHHETTGEVWMWQMDGTTRLAETWIATVADADYRIVGTGDYNGDGKADVLWHHATRGEVWVWLMDGTARLSESWTATVTDVGYRVAMTVAGQPLPVVSVVATPPTATEGGAAGVFTFTRTGDVSLALSGVTYALTGTAESGTDFAPRLAASGSVSFAAGQATTTVTITALSDALAEGPETVVLTVTDGLAYDVGAAATATVTIADAPAPLIGTWSGGTGQTPSLEFKMYVDADGVIGIVTHLFSAGGCNVNIDLDPVLAVPITNDSFRLNFSFGSGTGIVAGTFVNGTTATGTLSASFSGLSGCVGSASTTWTATHIDPAAVPVVSVAAADPSASEVGPDPGAFTIARIGSVTEALSVQYNVSGTATNGSDYTSLPGWATIPAGQASVTVIVSPADDALVEGPETVVLTLNDRPAYQLAVPKTATVTIADNPVPIITVVATDSEAYEAGLDTGTFTFSRVGSTTLPLNVSYTLGGSASHGQDYEYIFSPVTIPAGQASVSRTVTPIQDHQAESPETVTLTLTDGAHYDLGAPAVATVTIADSATTVTVTATDPDASEVGLDPGTFTFTRTGPTAAALTVKFTTAGTATVGADFANTGWTGGATVVIPAGQTSVTKTVTPIADGLVEPDETVYVTMISDVNYNVGTPASATVTIVDQPVPVVTVVATDPTAAESDLSTGTFTISRTGDTTAALTVSYTLGGSATNASDYAPFYSPVTIPAGQASVTITVTPIQDWQAESPETVILTLIDGANYNLGPAGTQTATVTITSDE